MRDLTASQRKLRDDLLDEPLARYSDLELIDRFVELAEKVYGEEINKILLGQQEQEELRAAEDGAEPFHVTIFKNREGAPRPDFPFRRDPFDEWADMHLQPEGD